MATLISDIPDRLPGYSSTGSSTIDSAPDRTVINDTVSSAQEQQVTVAALDSVLPDIIGSPRIGGMLANVLSVGQAMVCWVLWGRGPIAAVGTPTLNDQALPAGTSVTHYVGTTTQPVDSTLRSAFAAINGMPVYGESLPGVAYTVFTFPNGDLSGQLQFNTVPQGRTLYDPRLDSTNGGVGSQRLADPSTWTFSRCPALALAWFLSQVEGKTLDWPSVATVANLNDTIVGTTPNTEVARLIDLFIANEGQTSAWVETLRTAAGCWVVPQGDTVKLVPDAAASSVATYDHASGNILAVSNDEIASAAGLPTVMEVIITDTSQIPWRDWPVLAKRAGVDAGTVDWAKSTIRMQWITRASQGMREAIELLNKLWLRAMKMRVEVMDEGLRHEPGDIITLNFADHGYSGLQLRVTNPQQTDNGWALACVKEDPAVWNTSVQAGPSVPNTNLPLPTNPPLLAGFTVAEQTFQNETGIFGTRIVISWADPAWPFVKEFRFEVISGANRVHSGTAIAPNLSYTTPGLPEGTYTVWGYIYSKSDTLGPGVSTSITLAGKAIPPGNVASLFGFEVGGRVFLRWSAADNPTFPGTPDPDVWRYEVRRGTTAQAWSAATVIDAFDALRMVDEGAPAGTWRYQVKAIDSVGQYSATAATYDVTVTTDAASFLVDTKDQTAPTLTNMASFTRWPTDAAVYYVTEDGVAFGTKFSSTLASYTNPLATYHNSLTSTWQGEAEDFGLLLAGQWTGTATVAALNGSYTSYFGYHASVGDPAGFTYVTGLSQKVNARFANLKHEALTTATLLVTAPTQQIRIDAVPRDEVGSGTSSSSGPVTITLANVYVACKKLSVTAMGATARMAVADNIVTGNPTRFDVYVFDTGGNRIASAFRYEWQGV